VTGARAQVASGGRSDGSADPRPYDDAIALGFGHFAARSTWGSVHVRGPAVVGSALVSVIAEESATPDLIARVEDYVAVARGAQRAMSTLDDLRNDIDRVDECWSAC